MDCSRFERLIVAIAALVIALFIPTVGICAGGMHDLSLQLGAQLEVYWVIPFAGMLLSIAVCPLTMPRFWHHHFGKVAVFWAFAFLVPFAIVHGVRMDSIVLGMRLGLYELLHAMLGEYLPFIILLFSLYTVAGGIRLKGTLSGTPAGNIGILCAGLFLASWMGTTGAAMFLIRPLLRANMHRKYKTHTIIFFIFLVANIGGALTPLGDPPLFLGFLAGVDFFWPLTHLLKSMLVLSAMLLLVFFLLDTWLFVREGKPSVSGKIGGERFGFEGIVNFPLLLCIVGLVLGSGVWKPGIRFSIYEVPMELQNMVRDILLLCVAGASWIFTNKQSRELNNFNWAPIQEVAKLFFGIFISMIPALAILKAGSGGALAPLINLVSANGVPNDSMFFWLTGVLSSFLDNAPTYLVFFNTAGGLSGHPDIAPYLMTEWASTLTAISAGAVFMGANTYIGNAPNFMVRSIAEDYGVRMPSFFGYMAWSGVILIPLFMMLSWLFF